MCAWFVPSVWPPFQLVHHVPCSEWPGLRSSDWAINALREVFWQRVGKFLFKSIITLCTRLAPMVLDYTKLWYLQWYTFPFQASNILLVTYFTLLWYMMHVVTKLPSLELDNSSLGAVGCPSQNTFLSYTSGLLVRVDPWSKISKKKFEQSRS